MGNAPLGTKNRPWRARISYKNNEASAAISLGMPVVLDTSDPGGVVTPNTGAADGKNHFLCAGIAGGDINAGQFGDVVVAGYHVAARILRMTRAASTDSWASYPAIALADYFTIDSVNNALQRSGAAAASIGPPAFAAMETKASYTTAASNVHTTIVPQSATALTQSLKIWIRQLD